MATIKDEPNIKEEPVEEVAFLHHIKSGPGVTIKQEPIDEAVHINVPAVTTVTPIRANASQQSTNGLIMGAFGLAATSTITTNFPTTTPPQVLKVAAPVSSARKPPPSYEEGQRFVLPFGKWTGFKWESSTSTELINLHLIPHSGYRPHNEETTEDDILDLFQSAYATRSLIEIKLYLNDELQERYHISIMHPWHTPFSAATSSRKSVLRKILRGRYAIEFSPAKRYLTSLSNTNLRITSKA